MKNKRIGIMVPKHKVIIIPSSVFSTMIIKNVGIKLDRIVSKNTDIFLFPVCHPLLIILLPGLNYGMCNVVSVTEWEQRLHVSGLTSLYCVLIKETTGLVSYWHILTQNTEVIAPFFVIKNGHLCAMYVIL